MFDDTLLAQEVAMANEHVTVARRLRNPYKLLHMFGQRLSVRKYKGGQQTHHYTTIPHISLWAELEKRWSMVWSDYNEDNVKQSTGHALAFRQSYSGIVGVALLAVSRMYLISAPLR